MFRGRDAENIEEDIKTDRRNILKNKEKGTRRIQVKSKTTINIFSFNSL